jgi:hypothetical protein
MRTFETILIIQSFFYQLISLVDSLSYFAYLAIYP